MSKEIEATKATLRGGADLIENHGWPHGRVDALSLGMKKHPASAVDLRTRRWSVQDAMEFCAPGGDKRFYDAACKTLQEYIGGLGLLTWQAVEPRESVIAATMRRCAVAIDAQAEGAN